MSTFVICLQICTLSRQLRSSAENRIPSINTISYGKRSFSYSDPSLWNIFPIVDSICQPVPLDQHSKLFIFQHDTDWCVHAYVRAFVRAWVMSRLYLLDSMCLSWEFCISCNCCLIIVKRYELLWKRALYKLCKSLFITINEPPFLCFS